MWSNCVETQLETFQKKKNGCHLYGIIFCSSIGRFLFLRLPQQLILVASNVTAAESQWLLLTVGELLVQDLLHVLGPCRKFLLVQRSQLG